MRSFVPLAFSAALVVSARGEAPTLEIGLYGDGLLDGVYENRGSDERPDGWLEGVTKPVLSIYAPAGDKPSRAAVIVFPGGGYAGQAVDKEGHFVAHWLAERGVVGVVAPYRCGGPPHTAPIPLRDAERAVRLTRQLLNQQGAGPHRVGVIGFSAGGHLAATVATKGADADPESADPVERFRARPDFAALIYPVISMREGVTHGGSRERLLGRGSTEAEIAAWSADEQVAANTPPTFLVHSADDRSVPIENAWRYAEACRKSGVPAELHVFPTGGHGYGMWAQKGAVVDWPLLFERWLIGLGAMPP